MVNRVPIAGCWKSKRREGWRGSRRMAAGEEERAEQRKGNGSIHKRHFATAAAGRRAAKKKMADRFRVGHRDSSDTRRGLHDHRVAGDRQLIEAVGVRHNLRVGVEGQLVGHQS